MVLFTLWCHLFKNTLTHPAAPDILVYKNKFIIYSLGNFCTYGMFSLKGPNGIAPILQLKINGKGNFLSASIVSVQQDKINRLTLDPDHEAFKKIETLTNADFPGHRLEFTDNKWIRLKAD